VPEEKTPAQKAGSAQKAARQDTPISGDFASPGDAENITEDGEYAGDVRYEGTVLVERDVDGEWVSVLTDKPRPGDRVPAKELNVETGEREISSRKSDEGHATPPRR
jgi:hypothetical protein